MDSLEQVLNMSEKKSKGHVQKTVEKIVKRLPGAHIQPMVKISFSQFFEIVINDDLN